MRTLAKILKTLFVFSACYALFNEAFGFAAIWFAVAEIIKMTLIPEIK